MRLLRKVQRNRLPILWSFFLLLALVGVPSGGSTPKAQKPVRVLIVTGGHPFEREPFFQMFSGFKEIQWDSVEQPQANDLLASEKALQYDVIVLYDMWQEITSLQKTAFLKLFREKGKGLVALHHSLDSYQNWDDYARLVGGRHFLGPGKAPDGKTYERSEYHGDVLYPVRILNPQHPITKGLPSFEMRDETYKNFWRSPSTKPLLGTQHPLSDPVIGWVQQQGKARIVYLQPGHGPSAYRHPLYRELVRRAILWTARRRE
jgi:type 1 glutamine amidotransferase